MKRTAVLCAQHVGRMMKWSWYVKGKVKIRPTRNEKVLKNHGYEVVDIKDVLYPPIVRERIDVVGMWDREIPYDENHPDYKTEPCFKYVNENVLLEGLEQAQVLTNTIVRDALPDHLIESSNSLKLPDEFHSEIQRRIKFSCVFDATQQKLPKRKDPLRPAWNFPRDYGIPDTRKNELLCKNLVSACDLYLNNSNSSVVNNVYFCAPFKAHGKNIMFELASEVVVTTSERLKKLENASTTVNESIPDLHPVHCTVSLVPYNFYEMENIYPPSIKSKHPYVQTAFLSYNPTEVKNLFEEPVTETQIEARSLMKGFTVAATQARALYGDDVLELPEPIIVPVVHSDAQFYHFTIYQLNTLEIDKESAIKNVFWNSPRISLYEKCQYESARPVLTGYNSDVINNVLTFMSIK